MLSAARGNAGEAAILAALVINQGLHVFVPFGDGQPYDLVVDLGGPLLRVQCKRAWRQGGCMLFNSLSTDHGKGPRSYVGRADIFGVYFPPTDTVYLVPIDAVSPRGGRLRLEPARNNQRKRIRMAADFEIDRWTPKRLAAYVPSAIPMAA